MSPNWGAEPTAGKQVELKLEVAADQHMEYLCYLPADYQAGGAKKWPLMLFLHGRGESNGPVSLVAKWGPPQMAARGDDWKYILISPQCPASESWSQDRQQTALIKLLDHAQKTWAVDPDRVYLTGLSMGGYGSWKLAADHPERFAAVVPICGGGNPADAAKLAQLPIWAWHGDRDSAVPYAKTVEMVDAIKAAGGKSILFTGLEHVEHNSWQAAYSTPQLYDWFDKHTISGRGK